MQELKVGEKYALLVVVAGDAEDLWVSGTLVAAPSAAGIAEIEAPHGRLSVHEKMLFRVVTSARRAVVGDVLIQDGRGVVVEDEDTLLWLRGVEERLEKELDHRRKEERAVASLKEGAKQKKRERANRKRKQEHQF